MVKNSHSLYIFTKTQFSFFVISAKPSASRIPHLCKTRVIYRPKFSASFIKIHPAIFPIFQKRKRDINSSVNVSIIANSSFMQFFYVFVFNVCDNYSAYFVGWFFPNPINSITFLCILKWSRFACGLPLLRICFWIILLFHVWFLSKFPSVFSCMFRSLAFSVRCRISEVIRSRFSLFFSFFCTCMFPIFVYVFLLIFQYF